LTRDETEAEMRAIREIVDAARAATRILSAPDATALEEAKGKLLVRFGAVEIATAGGVGRAAWCG
jgi:hypothetical protein